jgi:hypothetical protein
MSPSQAAADRARQKPSRNPSNQLATAFARDMPISPHQRGDAGTQSGDRVRGSNDCGRPLQTVGAPTPRYFNPRLPRYHLTELASLRALFSPNAARHRVERSRRSCKFHCTSGGPQIDSRFIASSSRTSCLRRPSSGRPRRPTSRSQRPNAPVNSPKRPNRPVRNCCAE